MYTAAEQLLSQLSLTLIKDKEKSPLGFIPLNEFFIHFTQQPNIVAYACNLIWLHAQSKIVDPAT